MIVLLSLSSVRHKHAYIVCGVGSEFTSYDASNDASHRSVTFTSDAKAFALHTSNCMHIRAAFFEPECVRVYRCQQLWRSQMLFQMANGLRAQKQPHRRMLRCVLCVCLCLFLCCLCPHSVDFLNGSAVVCELVANKVATAVSFLTLEFLNWELIVVHSYL